MDSLLDLLQRYKYAAMFGILFFCGLGLPIPEELTLIASGLAVGWQQADFLYASIACVLGILAGDLLIFSLGRFCGRRFLASRPMRIILTEKRQRKINVLFAKHGSKAVFFARFFAGVRIGVYAYAGQHGMSVFRFLFLDLLGALISGPTSIFVGKLVAERIAEPEEARAVAQDLIRTGHHWLYAAFALLAVAILVYWLIRRARANKLALSGPRHPPGVSSSSGAPDSEGSLPSRGPTGPGPAREEDEVLAGGDWRGGRGEGGHR